MNICPKCDCEEKSETSIKDIVITDIKSVDLYKENELIIKITPRKEENKWTEQLQNLKK